MFSLQRPLEVHISHIHPDSADPKLVSVFALGVAGIICAFMRESEVGLVAEVSSG